MADNGSTNKSFLAADLFAGAGGFSLSAQNLGIKIAAAVEFDKHAASTYRKNFIEGKDTPPILFEENISSLTPGRFMKEAGLGKGDLDIIMGGPPCQGFSTHRIKGAGVGDERNQLLIRYFQYVSALRPKMFILENVPGLLWPRHKSYLDDFYRQANSNKYKVYDPLIMNAQDFGAPQNRKRVFIHGVAREYEGHLVWPPSKSHSSPKACEEGNGLMP